MIKIDETHDSENDCPYGKIFFDMYVSPPSFQQAFGFCCAQAKYIRCAF